MVAAALILVVPVAVMATTDPAELTEPAVVIEVSWEHQDSLIMLYSAVHEQNGDPTLNPAGGISAGYGAGCTPDAVTYDAPLPLILTADPAFDRGYYGHHWQPGTYNIVVYSNAWCVYYLTGSGVRLVDVDRADALMASLPEGTEVTVTATVTYYNIPGAETQVFTGSVPVSSDATDPAMRRVLGSVVLPELEAEGAGPVSGEGATDGGSGLAPASEAETLGPVTEPAADPSTEGVTGRAERSEGDEGPGVGVATAVGIVAAALGAGAAAATVREPELDPSWFPDETGESLERTWWYVEAGEELEKTLPPVYSTAGVGRGALPYVPRRWRRLHRKVYGQDFLVGMLSYDVRAEVRRKRRGLSFSQEWQEILADMPPDARGRGGQPSLVVCGRLFKGSRQMRRYFDEQREIEGRPPMTKREVVRYRRWANRYYSWSRRWERAFGARPEGRLDDASPREFTSTAGGRG